MEAWLVKQLGETGAKVVSIAIPILLGALLLTLAYCSGHKNGKTGEVVKEQSRTIEVQQKTGVANEAAADQRVHDIVKQQQQQQELDNATVNGSDLTRQQRGCVILRQQGRDTSHIPACS